MSPGQIISFAIKFEKLAKENDIQAKLNKLWIAYQKAEKARDKGFNRYEKAREKLTKFMSDNEVTMDHLKK